jgi:hypothetical protein
VNQYLQRMASSAIKPGGTIHPIVDSVYSTRREYSYKPWIDENESVAETRIDQGPTGSETAAMITPPLTARVDASPLPKPILDEIEPAVTEQLRARRFRPSFAHPVEAETIAAAENSHELVAGSKNKAQETGQATRKETLSGEVQRTEFPGPEIGAIRVSSRPPKVVSASRNPGAFEPKARTLQRLEPPVREPDEIQIHIGRIEVTAVHPASTQAPAKPQRNVPSLDEYLRRRDRRST